MTAAPAKMEMTGYYMFFYERKGDCKRSHFYGKTGRKPGGCAVCVGVCVGVRVPTRPCIVKRGALKQDGAFKAKTEDLDEEHSSLCCFTPLYPPMCVCVCVSRLNKCRRDI